MDNKSRQNAPTTTVTVNRKLIAAPTGNIYMAIEIIAKRAEQIQQELAEEYKKKAEPFMEVKENLQETFVNEELINISRYYEKLPKPWALALQEWIEGKIAWKFEDEKDKDQD